MEERGFACLSGREDNDVAALFDAVDEISELHSA
jgi:hypothetical protein